MTPDESRMVAVLGRALWNSALTSRNGELRSRMRRPVPGDLIVETTRRGEPRDPDMCGWLVRIEGDAGLGGRWVVEPLHRPGEEQGGVNASFVAIAGPGGASLL